MLPLCSSLDTFISCGSVTEWQIERLQVQKIPLQVLQNSKQFEDDLKTMASKDMSEDKTKDKRALAVKEKVD
jgi:hypothetical protein